MPEGHKGDCLSACLASLLELPLEEVPLFDNFADWPQRVDEFTRRHGYAFVGYRADHEYTPPPSCFHIVVGPTKNNPDMPDDVHAVVAWRNLPIHDPNRGGMFIDEIQSRWLLVPTTAMLPLPDRRSPFSRYVWWRDWVFMTAAGIALGLLIFIGIVISLR